MPSQLPRCTLITYAPRGLPRVSTEPDEGEPRLMSARADQAARMHVAPGCRPLSEQAHEPDCGVRMHVCRVPYACCILGSRIPEQQTGGHNDKCTAVLLAWAPRMCQ